MFGDEIAALVLAARRAPGWRSRITEVLLRGSIWAFRGLCSRGATQKRRCLRRTACAAGDLSAAGLVCPPAPLSWFRAACPSSCRSRIARALIASGLSSPGGCGMRRRHDLRCQARADWWRRRPARLWSAAAGASTLAAAAASRWGSGGRFDARRWGAHHHRRCHRCRRCIHRWSAAAMSVRS